MLCSEDRDLQAEKFLTAYRLRPGSFDEVFAFWADSKDFWLEDRLAIRRIVVAELLARGELSSVGLEYLPEEVS